MKNIQSFLGSVLVAFSTIAGAADLSYGSLISIETDTLGSYAQWTKHVAVTVKHVQALDALYVDSCADIQFIPREGKPPAWSEYQQTDEVIAVGNTIVKRNGHAHIEQAESTGKILNGIVKTCDDKVITKTHSAEVFPGMSGSPLYRAKDGAALGINVATGIKGSEFEGYNEFIPTSLIRTYWEYAVAHNLIPAKYLEN